MSVREKPCFSNWQRESQYLCGIILCVHYMCMYTYVCIPIYISALYVHMYITMISTGLGIICSIIVLRHRKRPYYIFLFRGSTKAAGSRMRARIHNVCIRKSLELGNIAIMRCNFVSLIGDLVDYWTSYIHTTNGFSLIPYVDKFLICVYYLSHYKNVPQKYLMYPYSWDWESLSNHMFH